MNAASLPGRQFTRRREDFVCEHCGYAVRGSGYTNHCPRCLVSKHVDVHPGDRAAGCGGLMDPKDLRLDHGEWKMKHVCRRCGFERWNRVSSADFSASIEQLAHQLARQKI